MCCVQCPIFVQVCPSHQLGDSYCVGRSCSLRDQVQIQSPFFNDTVWLSNRTKIPLESGSSADKRFRTDLKIFNKNCIIYVSQANVQSERRCVRETVRSEAELIWSLASFLFLLLRHEIVQPIRSMLPYPSLGTFRAYERLPMGLEHICSPRSNTSIENQTASLNISNRQSCSRTLCSAQLRTAFTV